MNYKGFLIRIKNLRTSKALKQKQMANSIHVERSVYTRKEHGDVPITVDELFILASLLGMTPEDLVADAPLHILSRRLDILINDSYGTPLHDIIMNQITGLLTLFESQLHINSNPHKKRSA